MSELHFVEANGLKFGLLGWGLEDRSRPLVLALHGFPDTAHTWSEIGPELAEKGFRVAAPFLRGYAPTEAPQRDTTFEDLGKDVIALVEALGAERAHLVGHDWGAEAVYAAIGIAPERVQTLTAIAIPHRARVRFTWKMIWGLRHFIGLTLPGAEARFARNDLAAVEMLMERWSPRWRPSEGDLAPIKECLRQSTHAALGYYRAASLRTPAIMKAPITAPMLYIAGLDDPAVTVADFERTRAHFQAGLEIAAIPGGHFCHREAPEACVEALLRHLESPQPTKKEKGEVAVQTGGPRSS